MHRAHKALGEYFTHTRKNMFLVHLFDFFKVNISFPIFSLRSLFYMLNFSSYCQSVFFVLTLTIFDCVRCVCYTIECDRERDTQRGRKNPFWLFFANKLYRLLFTNTALNGIASFSLCSALHKILVNDPFSH